MPPPHFPRPLGSPSEIWESDAWARGKRRGPEPPRATGVGPQFLRIIDSPILTRCLLYFEIGQIITLVEFGHSTDVPLSDLGSNFFTFPMFFWTSDKYSPIFWLSDKILFRIFRVCEP